MNKDYRFWLRQVAQHRKKLQIAGGVAFLILVSFLYFSGQGREPESAGRSSQGTSFVVDQTAEPAHTQPTGRRPDEPPGEAAAPERIAVDIDGAVQKPAVYLLPPHTRIYQGIDAAGGLLENAETRHLNLAAVLEDGSKLYVPFVSEADANLPSGSAGTENPSSAANSGYYTVPSAPAAGGKVRINLNTAGAGELETLPGVGPATAEKILRYRQENDRFRSIEELLDISGIGEKTYAKLKDEVTVQ